MLVGLFNCLLVHSLIPSIFFYYYYYNYNYYYCYYYYYYYYCILICFCFVFCFLCWCFVFVCQDLTDVIARRKSRGDRPCKMRVDLLFSMLVYPPLPLNIITNMSVGAELSNYSAYPTHWIAPFFAFYEDVCMRHQVRQTLRTSRIYLFLESGHNPINPVQMGCQSKANFLMHLMEQMWLI